MKIKTYLVFIALCAIMISCSGDAGQENFDRDQLRDIIWDLHVARAATYGQPAELRDSMMDVYKDQIAKIHQIERSELEGRILLLKEDQELYIQLLEEARKHVADSLH